MTKEKALKQIKELEEYIKNIPVSETQLKEQIQKIFSSDSWEYINFIKQEFKMDDKYIYFKLPPENKEWFFTVMKIAEKICTIKGFHIYPCGNIEENVLKLKWTKKDYVQH